MRGPGGVAERLIAPVLKTGRPKGLVSSNLTPSASLIIRHLQHHALRRIMLLCKDLGDLSDESAPGTRAKSAHALPLSDFGSKRFVIYGFRMDDSRWIKWFTIATAVLTASLVFLTIVLARYASRLDVLTDALVASQRPNQLSSPTPEQSPTPTDAPIPRAIPIATPSLTPSPSPHPARVPRRHPRRHR